MDVSKLYLYIIIINETNMSKQELKSEQKRIKDQIKSLTRIADISEDAQLQIEFLSEELKWIEQQLLK